MENSERFSGETQTMKRNAIAWAALVVSVAALVGSRGYNRPLPAAQDIPQEGQKVARDLSEAFHAVAEFVSPSVVQINIEKKGPGIRMRRGGPNGPNMQPIDPKEMEELLKRFFGGQGQGFNFEDQQFAAEGTGSGFVYDDQGHILTNNHVVEGADKITVTFQDGVELPAKIVGRMPEADVAVIKVDSTEYPPARIGSSKGLSVGEWVMAVGSPFGLSQTVTAGIVSATERDNVDINQFESFIQTDAAGGGGGGGGPLVDMDGRVVGINSAIATMTRSSAGVGFAIPIDMAKRLADKLIKNGKVEHALMGVSINPLSPALAKKLGLDPKTEGVVVVEVGPGTPADEAGFKVGDVITKYDGTGVHSLKGLQYLVSTSDIGKSYPVTFLRKGKEMTTKVSPEPLSEVAAVMRPNAQVDERPQAVSKDEVNDFGIAVTGLNDELAERYGWAGKKGVMISSVKPESPAAAAGLEVGDLITKVIKDETIASVESVEDFEAVVKDSKEIAVYVEDVNHRLPGDFKVLAKPESK
jgi:serine protease Do